ncbi:ribonuclease H2, subunit C [Thelephora terrestris]|uniref:Ribonuclease H2, subunit C n=1 Tax=Thelephora terrestris TaxID=56493 RepID=A0A9P6HGQ7_9AGAM|nr:ribonuclease H2, subunit C [Thelephora terrestris]
MSIQLIVPEKGSLPERSLNLMPFNIRYTGTAPVSTYFRPKQLPVQGDPPTDAAAGSQEGTSQLSTATDTPNLAEPSKDPVTAADVTSKEESLIAAFRGRTIRGTRVSVPHGYTGVVLIGADANKTKHSSPPPSGRRPSRRSGRVIHVDEDDGPQDVDMNEASEGTDADGEEGEEPTRTLTLASVFNSFTVWNPDIPVDVGRDEYARSLTEWTKLSAMIHHNED